MMQSHLLQTQRMTYRQRLPRVRSPFKALCWFFALLFISAPSVGFSGSFAAFGPENYLRETGKPVTVTKKFTVLNPNTSYTIRIDNGGASGEFERVSSAVVMVNGSEIVGPNEFNQNVAVVEKPVALGSSNELAVELRSEPASGFTVQIIGVDNDPPTITASVNPPSNAAGWNNTDVTVSFTCSDGTSGIATCPSPVSATQEGANQVISGTATDMAGNSASTSVLISLDKTAPIVAITSPSNGATVSSSPVNVTGTATDNLSGIATVLCNGSAATLSVSTFSCDVPLTNGPNTITVEATDVAGNKASSSITVTLGEPQNFPSAINAQGDLSGENWADQIVFNWAYHTGASEYIVYRSTSASGPWEELGKMSDAVARTSGPKIDDTPDARLMDLCYKVEAIDTLGLLIRTYEPICVPKFVEKQKQSFLVREQSGIIGQVEKIGGYGNEKKFNPCDYFSTVDCFS